MVGPIATTPLDTITIGCAFVDAAFDEAVKRHPESIDGLVWFATACALRSGDIAFDVLDWASTVSRRLRTESDSYRELQATSRKTVDDV